MKALTRLLCLALVPLAVAIAFPAGPRAFTWNKEKLTPEEIYARFGDEDDEISLRDALRQLLYLVNAARDGYGLEPLEWDSTASSAAEEQAREMADNRYLSHLNLDGEKPNLRYNRHGGTHQVTENLSYWESDVLLYLTPQVVEDVHRRWMESPSHCRNILTPTHTGVGMAIVIVWDGDRTVLTAAQEFVDAYGEFDRLPERAGYDDDLYLGGDFTDRHTGLAYVTIGYEEFPERQRAEDLNANLNGYSLPGPFVALLPEGDRHVRRVTGLPTLYLLTDDPSRRRFKARFSVEDVFIGLEQASRAARFKPGQYYFMVWAQREGEAPFLVSTQVVLVKD